MFGGRQPRSPPAVFVRARTRRGAAVLSGGADTLANLGIRFDGEALSGEFSAYPLGHIGHNLLSVRARL
ncbi:Uncharacterised protein [Mycobacteroides abscessus subsp. abscessus]|uniref:Uncharacterized protein n=1 Tax=Mycobacteroides abscessus subsp. abscessus TaxID=1185650 RepID=A0AB38D2K9_9MYCO|nr:hypothetical protein [Mycobacteroides abscessus]SHP55796.1 Uncharacterised protein [Mycobacteroides abscessus subsp. abscessus]CPS95075.1 Uncharacterised protein [Mycobacteroides abscessus]CPU25383.1 Uncharacterised protein [Mycobacteroides abscessus]CPU97709.1 Uncharacterised protein [Mycobacteroides abscessus]